MPKKRPARYYAWIFTLNNYTADDHLAMPKVPAAYLCFGLEVAPTTGTPHMQGYVRFAEACSLKQASRMIPRASLRRAFGSVSDNVKYTSKDEWFYEYGIRPGENGSCSFEQIAHAKANPDNHMHILKQYGKTYDDVCIQKARSIKRDTKFYKIKPDGDFLESISLTLKVPIEDMKVVGELRQLSAWDPRDLGTVVFITNYLDPIIANAPQLKKISWSNGFQQYVDIRPTHFVLVIMWQDSQYRGYEEIELKDY